MFVCLMGCVELTVSFDLKILNFCKFINSKQIYYSESFSRIKNKTYFAELNFYLRGVNVIE